MSAHVIGRAVELAALDSFLDLAAAGPAALVLEGEAGVGKTTLWTAGTERAVNRGFRVLEARPAESETALTFSGIGDLLDSVLDDALTALPDPQRRALSRALMLADDEGPPPDPRAIGMAVLGAIRALADSRPTVLAIDDVQWLDAASAGPLAYAVRRLRSEPVGVLLARRLPIDSPLLAEMQRSPPPGGVAIAAVGPLQHAALHAVVMDQLGLVLPRPLLAEVHEASGGNAFHALEIIRTLQRTQSSVELGHPLPVPDSLRDLVTARLDALPPRAREALLIMSAASQPTLHLVEQASGVDRERWLPTVLEAGIVMLQDGRLRFTHPLLAAGAYDAADPTRRAQVHARLAEIIEDPEARGRHLAASVSEPGEEVAAALEEAAARACARGAPRAAALLLDRACALTPPDRPSAAHRRAVAAAYLHYESGDSPRAETQLRQLIGHLESGADRARALARLARVRSYRDQQEAAELFAQAIEEAGDDRETRAIAHEGVAACLFRMRVRLTEAVEHAEVAAGLALELGDEALAAEALGSKLLAESVLGLESARETTARALALQDAASDRRMLAQPRWTASVHWWWTDAHERAREANREALRRARDLGDESSAPYVLALTGFLDCILGEYDVAVRDAVEGQELARQSGQPMPLAYNLAVESLAWAERGVPEKARAAAERALALVPETAGRPAELAATWALGHLELVLGDAEAAREALAPIVEFARAERFGEPAAMRFVIDYVEALLGVGKVDQAGDVLDWYEGHARRLRRVSALAASFRCRGLLAAAQGRVDDALAANAQALEWHAEVDIPLDRGRTLLALGTAQRRSKRRREARGTLEQAIAVFERIGAALWAERARGELSRISGRAPAAGSLTPAEERVAALVAEGKTNRDVAAALFLSERTVEGHLTHVFGKLGVRSRHELTRELAARQTQGVESSNTGDPPVSAGPAAP